MLIASQPWDWNQRDSERVEKRGPWITTTVPPSRTGIPSSRFSTRSESRWFQSQGWEAINMTAYPEGYLARELELCYANVSMITDYDVGVDGTEPVTHEAVIEVFEEN